MAAASAACLGRHEALALLQQSGEDGCLIALALYGSSASGDILSTTLQHSTTAQRDTWNVLRRDSLFGQPTSHVHGSLRRASW